MKTSEECSVEVFVVGQLKAGNVESAGLAVKKADGRHETEGDDEKNPQHQGRVYDGQVRAYAFWFFSDHDLSTTQAAAGRTAVALSPCLMGGLPLGVD